MDIQARCVASYREHKNLKIVGTELGIAWQRVYLHLRAAGEPVTGDKARYGSETDKLAARAERWFARLMPEAHDNNEDAFQAKVDFTIGSATVDVKVSRPKLSKRGVIGWMWSVKKQEMTADHFVCLALIENGGELSVQTAFLLPGELVRHYSTIRVSAGPTGKKGKWWDYAVTPPDLREFLLSVGGLASAPDNDQAPRPQQRDVA